MAVFELKLTTLSPLHIGDGDELRQGFDFMVKDKKTYRLDEDRILVAKEAQLVKRRDGSYPLPGELLTARDYQDQALFRYILPGFPRSRRADARLKSCIKDVYDRPYIPGSSLKGALRTALAWTGWDEVRPRLDRAAIGRSRSWAGQKLESKLFGPDPNHDLLRALQVSDCAGPQKAGGKVMVVNAQVLTRRSAGSPVELEALAPNAEFHGSLHIDETLFSKIAEPKLRFANRKHWLDELIPRIQKHSLARIEELVKWFENAQDCAKIAAFYRRLAGLELGGSRAILQLGWGSGWDGKTFWTHLQKDEMLFEKLVSDFRLHRGQRGAPPRRPGDPFPRSKRAAMTVRQGVAKPAAPFGWVLFEMEKAS